MSRVLLVSPAFHGYWRSIESALVRRGHTVRTCRYDEHRPADKVRHQLRHELPRRLGRDVPSVDAAMTQRALDALGVSSGGGPEVVVIVKGDQLGPAFWERLDAAGLARVTWLYDELRRMRYDTATLVRAGPVASYSRLDVAALRGQGVEASYLPLAHDPHLASIDPRVRNDDVVFVGASYPRRVELISGLAAAGVPVRVFGRDWSRHPVDVLRTWGRRRPALPAGRDLDRCRAYAEMAAGLAALNVHGEQDGFTMRTFEAAGVGAVELVDRADVAELYEPDREVVVFDGLRGTDGADGPDGVDGLVEQVTRIRADPAWAQRVREQGVRRTLAEHTFDHRVARLEELWLSWA